MCLSNGITPQLIAPESCSSPQDLASLRVTNEKKLGGFLVSGIS